MVSRIEQAGRLVGLLYHSTVLDVTRRQRVNLLDTRFDPADKTSPILRVCSYCKRVEHPQDTQSWVTAEEYTVSGGTDVVRLSHGICSDCLRDVTASYGGI